MSDLTKVFVGMGVAGQALIMSTPEEVQIATFLLMGNYDQEVKAFLFWKHKGQPATDVEQLEEPVVLEQLERIKSVVRFKIQNIINAADAQEKQERQAQHLSLVNQLRKRNEPHHLGTVDEISKRYGISKSQVRRLKAEGRLDAFCDAASAMNHAELDAAKADNTSS